MGARMRQRRIVVFEDQANLHDLYRHGLASLGAVEIHLRPELALDQVADADLVVTDLEMPGMGGLGLLRWMREQELLMPTLLVTAAPEGEAFKAARALADAVLAKPFGLRQLRETARELLESPDAVHEGRPVRSTCRVV